MKKHKFSDKLPDVGIEIFAKMGFYHGAFCVNETVDGEYYIEATDYFIHGFNYSPEVFRKHEVLEDSDNWWADPEEES